MNTFRSLIFRAGLALTVACTALACRNPSAPPQTPPPPVDPPTLACPATVVADVQEAPAVVQYPAPVVTGGTAPVGVTCTIPTGSSFSTGLTDVVCTATDALARPAQCTFQVQVNITAKLRGTKFLAFGDSITWGEVSAPVPGFRVHAFDPVNNYPVVLGGLLPERYPSQASELRVINAGKQGAQVANDDDRFADEIAMHQPDAVLLLHGINDVHAGTPLSLIRGSLRADVRRALQRGAKIVFLSTLLPQVPGREKAHAGTGAILEANEMIREVALLEGAVLVDSYSAFDARKLTLIGQDGLHPTVEGYKLLAETFLASIKANFQAPPTPSAAGVGPAFVRPASSRPLIR